MRKLAISVVCFECLLPTFAFGYTGDATSMSAVQSDGGQMYSDLSDMLKDLNRNQKLKANALYPFIVAELMGNKDFQSLYEKREHMLLVIPAGNANAEMNAQFIQQIKLAKYPVMAFVMPEHISASEVVAALKTGTERRYGKIHLLIAPDTSALEVFMRARNLFPSLERPGMWSAAPVQSSPDLPKSPEEMKKLYRERITRLRENSLYRTLMDPAKRPYESFLLSQNKVDKKHAEGAKGIVFRKLLETEVIRCETLFYDQLSKELGIFPEKEGGQESSKQIVSGDELPRWKVIFKDMPFYYRQAIGYSGGGEDFIFIKYRRDIPVLSEPVSESGAASNAHGPTYVPPLPSNDKEYGIKDGGSHYFEFICNMTRLRVAYSFVHGEA